MMCSNTVRLSKLIAERYAGQIVWDLTGLSIGRVVGWQVRAGHYNRPSGHVLIMPRTTEYISFDTNEWQPRNSKYRRSVFTVLKARRAYVVTFPVKYLDLPEIHTARDDLEAF